MFLLKAPGKNPLLSLVAFGGIQQSLALFGFLAVSLQSLPLLSHGIFPVCPCLHMATFSSSKDTSHIELRGHPNDLILL